MFEKPASYMLYLTANVKAIIVITITTNSDRKMTMPIMMPSKMMVEHNTYLVKMKRKKKNQWQTIFRYLFGMVQSQ